jgi:hypothetical protein
MGRLWVLALFGAALVVLALAPYGSTATVQCVNAVCRTEVATSPVALAVSLGLLLFIGLYPQKQGERWPGVSVSVWERAAAFLIDSWTVLLIFSPFLALTLILVEADATGEFRWTFAREYSRPEDAILIPGVLGVQLTLFLYFFLHGRAERPTIGQYTLGLRLEGVPGAGERPRYLLHVALATVGLCLWPISVYLALRRSDRAFWWNGPARTRVVRLKS